VDFPTGNVITAIATVIAVVVANRLSSKQSVDTKLWDLRRQPATTTYHKPSYPALTLLPRLTLETRKPLISWERFSSQNLPFVGWRCSSVRATEPPGVALRRINAGSSLDVDAGTCVD
jgi:hypothetical protein